MVEGNYIGVTAGGSVALGNGANGVAVFAGANHTTIGGTVSGSRDVISGNNSDGVYISDSGTTGNVVEGTSSAPTRPACTPCPTTTAC